jgi:plastocyanin
VPDRRGAWLGVGLVAAGIILMMVAAALSERPRLPSAQLSSWGVGPGVMPGPGPANAGDTPGPGSPGFVAGTTVAPRVVRIVANDALRFDPAVVAVKQGETITFEVTTIGRVSHEFMVGPARDVATHRAGTPEIADIGTRQTKALTYTFRGKGPFAFACHVPGHYEAGMRGVIVVVP